LQIVKDRGENGPVQVEGDLPPSHSLGGSEGNNDSIEPTLTVTL